jgi:hypothetical protein
MEYMALVIFILGALLAMRVYILRSMSGKWKAAGDSFGQGRQYDPRPFGVSGEDGGTLVCRYEPLINLWVDRKRAEVECDCTLPPEDPTYAAKCPACLSAIAAATPFCN